MMNNLEEKMEEKHQDIMSVLSDIKSDVKETKEQTIKTNGRVSKLEWWRNSFLWALGALWTLLLISFPILRWIVQSEIHQSVNVAVQDAFDNRFSSIEIK